MLTLHSESVMVCFDDVDSSSCPNIYFAVRNEDFTFTLHLRVLHRRDMTSNTFSRDRLQALYRIVRYILENNAFRPTVYATPADTTSAVLGDADLIRLTSRSEANDRGKRLLGYKIAVELKRFARATV